MSKRKYEPGAFVPCSSKHKSCSPAHASLVQGYRAERERQLLLFEAVSGGYKGDIKIWKENHSLITFKTWLKANARNHASQSDVKHMVVNHYTVMNNHEPIVRIVERFSLGEQNEEECNCDCDVCCRNDHIACEFDCAC